MTLFLFEVLSSFPAQHLVRPNEIQAFLSYSKLIGNGHLLCIKFLDFIIEWYIPLSILKEHIGESNGNIGKSPEMREMKIFFLIFFLSLSLKMKMKMKILTNRPCTFTIKHQIAPHRVKNCAIVEQFHAYIHWVYGL